MNKALRIATPLVAGLLLGALALLSISGIVDPAASAARFGVRADDPASQFYHAVYRDRNLVLAAVGLIFLVTRMWRPLAILASASITLPIYDIAALASASTPIAPVHHVTLVALLLLSALLWWRVRDATAQMRAA